MNFLQICQRAGLECGVSGSLTSVVSQTGDWGEIVTWCGWADTDIQASETLWDFLRNDFTFATIVGTSTYAITAVSLEELATWKADSLRISLSTLDDEQWLTFMPWSFFRDSRFFGSSRTTTGRPTEFSVKPDKSLIVWPLPDDEYDINGEYFKRPQSMTANGDTPLIPQQFHMAIVWRAVMGYARFHEADNILETAMREYKSVLTDLKYDQLPPPEDVEPLA